MSSAIEKFVKLNSGDKQAKWANDIIEKFEKIVNAFDYTGGNIVIRSYHPSFMDVDIIKEIGRIINNEKIRVSYISPEELPSSWWWSFANGVYNNDFTPEIIKIRDQKPPSYLWFHMEK